MNRLKIKSKKRSILFVLPNLQGGGAEKTAINLLSSIDKNKYDCRVMVLRNEGVHLQTAIDAGWLIESPKEPGFLRKMSLENPLRILFSAWQIRKVATQNRPDIILTFMSDTSIPMYLSRTREAIGAYWIAREGNNTPRTIKETIDNKILQYIAHKMVGISLRSCDQLLCISKGMIDTFSKAYQVTKENINVIYNPVNLSKLQTSAYLKNHVFNNPLMKMSLDDRRPMVLAVGRLSHQKGFDILIRAFSNTLAKKGFQLTILGEGDQREMLENLIKDLKLEDQVYLPGYHEHPELWMKKAHCFVLSSRWEGFGHVVVEAMTTGTPIISTQCHFGPEEILENGQSGKLVPIENQLALEDALVEMTDKNQSHIPKRVARAQQRAKDFCMNAIVAEYEQLFASVSFNRGSL